MTSLHFKWSCWSALNQNHEGVAPSYFYTLGWVSLLMHTLFMWKVHLHRVFKPFDGDDDAYYPSIHTSIFFTACLALRLVGILEPVLSSCCLWPQTRLHPGKFASFLEGPLKKTKNIFNHTHPNGQTRVANSPHLPLFGAEWEQKKRYRHRLGENIQTVHRLAPEMTVDC